MILLLASLGFAQELDDDEAEGDRVTEGAPALRLGPSEAPPPRTVRAGEGTWPATVSAAATALSLEEDFIGACYEAAEDLYARDYAGAGKRFTQIEQAYPGRGVGNTGLVLVLQSNMMENFDFRGESKYRKHSAAAREELTAGLSQPGAEAWEHFLLGALAGVDAIHTMRRGDYVPAIKQGFDAVEHIDQTRALAPDFKDILLLDGLWDYWKSAASLSSKAIPDEDNRAQGIQRMQRAEQEAAFLGPGASLALAFTYIEERDYDSALVQTARNHKAYPDNVINNLVHARNLIYLRRYDSSIGVLKQILRDDTDNQRAHYYLATCYLRTSKLDQATEHIDTYLGFAGLDDYYRAQAQSRKGDIAFKSKDYATAESWYRQAVKTDGYSPAKRRLKKLKEMKKEGVY
ncbi:MAG: tetratricopeptide repeat protein [Myxococcota bacterium]|nr:tetratricopeptide repeat protein [Myxococcota bacterium]